MPKYLVRFLLLALVLVGLPAAAAAQSAPSALIAPRNGAVVRGTVDIVGVAHGSDFAKWQVDLLPAGQTDAFHCVAVDDAPHTQPDSLATLTTTAYADGAYVLRLRVVRRDGNYDEYTSAVTIANQSGVAANAAQPAASQPMRASRAAALGLPKYTAAGQPILYLTFDDGPSSALTPQIVELLGQYGAKATFFVIGVHVRRAPAALRPVAEAGHTIANHTLAHKSLAGTSRAAFAKELQDTETIVQRAVGDLLPPDHLMRFLRPPGGATDANTAAYAAELGYQVAAWDIDPKDWRRPGAAAIASHVLRRAFPGAVVVLHDGGGGSQQTVTALGAILAELSAQGYVFRGLNEAQGTTETAQASSDKR
jgi:peptidoglycan/xylan/chitin deacetylase (PgdA/CDA1 family)